LPKLENRSTKQPKPYLDMSRIQLAKRPVRREFKRKKFPYVIQVVEELGQRIERTPALKTD
jgi:hypothetical protein